MTSRKKVVLLGTWGVLFAIGALCAGVFVQGVLRDHRVGEPVIDIDLSTESDWQTTSFRLWGEGDYRLILSSVNHDKRLVGRPFDGRLEVQVSDPDGRLVLNRVYDPPALDYPIPYNYGDTRLAEISLSGWPFRTWQLRTRIVGADGDFRGVRSKLKFWKERDDPGMGGLITYAMIVPAGIFLVLALLVSLPLANGGIRTPVISTGLIVAAFLLFIG